MWIDNAKIIGAFLVVFAHLYLPYSNERLYIYAFHMPFFFFVSGMFHKTKELSTYVKKYISPILLFFVFFSISYIPLVIGGSIVDKDLFCTDDRSNSISDLFFTYIGKNTNAFFMGADNSNVVLWFLFALFYCVVIFALLRKNPVLIIPFVILFLSFLYYRFPWMYIGQALMGFPFFVLGYFLKDYILRIIPQIKTVSKITLVLVLFLCQQWLLDTMDVYP